MVFPTSSPALSVVGKFPLRHEVSCEFSLLVACCSETSGFSKKQSLKQSLKSMSDRLEIVLDDSGHVLRRRAREGSRMGQRKRYVSAQLWACKGASERPHRHLCCPSIQQLPYLLIMTQTNPCRRVPPSSACLSVASGGDGSFKCRSLLFPLTGAFYQ